MKRRKRNSGRAAGIGPAIISRRGFLRLGCTAVATMGMSAALNRFGMMSALAGATADYRALVCVFLFGGNDSNNVIVPTDNTRLTQYQQARADLALAANTLLPIGDSHGNTYGLHPALSNIQSLYSQKAAAIVLNVGSLVGPLTKSAYQNGTSPAPSNLFSHSDQQTQWQSSVPNATLSVSGWGGRIADTIGSGSNFPAGMSVAGNTLFLAGLTTTPTTVVPNATNSPLGLFGDNGMPDGNARNAAIQQMLSFNTGFALVQAANGIMSDGLSVDSLLNGAFKSASKLQTVFPGTDIGGQLQQIAKIIQVRSALGVNRQIFFCSLGGFDTHSAQLGIQGNLLSQLSAALGAFYAATQELGVDHLVTTFTESDFNRTFQPNSNAGSDHAWGSNHLVIGGAVNGGDVYGTLPQYELSGPDDANNRGVWIPGFGIDQYGATLASWFGLDANQLNTVFTNLSQFNGVTNLGFMGA
ncbi:MAG TPA: DUF1501 domain-containing protein [Candidatus Acidoferrales bacterium]|nr:DUF1501 domain-containing protein [Candidatus Acidoferrales bacterium]